MWRGALLILLLLLSGCTVSEDPSPAVPEPPALGCVVPCVSTIRDGPNFEPHLAQDPLNPEKATLAVKGGGNGFTVLSTEDMGASWTETELAPPGDGVHEGWSHYGDPVVTHDGSAITIAGIGHHQAVSQGAAYAGEGRDILVIRSEGGQPFGPPSVVWEGDGALAVAAGVGGSVLLDNGDKPWIHTTPTGKIHAIWVAIRGPWGPAYGSQGNALLYASSTDGDSWTDPIVLATGYPRMPVIRALEDRHVAVAWGTYDTPMGQLAISQDGGATWQAREIPQVSGQALIVTGEEPALLAPFAVDTGNRLGLLGLRDPAAEPRYLAPVSEARDGLVTAREARTGLHIGWYQVNGEQATYHAGYVEGGALQAARLLDTDLHPETGRYGHYVVGTLTDGDLARHVWVGGDGELRTALVHLDTGGA